MTGTETDVIEWRATPSWVLPWLAFMMFAALPFLALGAWLAAKSIAEAPPGTWPAYLFFLGAFATLVLGVLTIGILAGIVAHVRLLFDATPFARADKHGLEVRMPYRPLRQVSWRDIESIEIERQRPQGRYRTVLNHILVHLRDKSAPELSVKPQMAGLTLEEGHQKLTALYAKFR